MNVINSWKQANFVLTPGPLIIMVGATSLILGLQVAGSQTSTVHESAVACTVTDMEASQERVTARLSCVTTSGVVRTSTNQGTAVLRLLQTGTQRLTCDLYVAGNVGNCVVPEPRT